MKRKVILILAVMALSLLFVSACDAEIMNVDGSIKNITKPYIAQYECTEARLGEKDLLEDYDYIRIILVDKEKMAVCYKPKEGAKKVFEGTYTLDPETRELEGELGVLGFPFKEKVIVKNGQFTISKIFMNKELFVKFKVI